jgi:Family of unknown function (DUF6188)
MYGLPEDLDLSFFVGKRLDTIAFAEFVIHFNFEGNVSVTLESSFQHQRRLDVEKNWFGVQQSLPVAHSGLMQLVGRSVVSAVGDKEGTLTLSFDDGQVLCFFEHRSPSESYEFTDGEHYFIV